MKNTGTELGHAQIPRRKLNKLLIIVVATLVVATVGAFWARRRNQPQATVVCSSALLKQAAAALPAGKEDQLGQVVSQIQKLPNYQQDPNCLYPILAYHINTGDPTGITTYMSEFNKTYNAKRGLSSDLGSVKSQAVLQDETNFVQAGSAQTSTSDNTFADHP